MQKEVYCLIGQRCKCIKYMQAENVSDATSIREALKKASKTDGLLSQAMCGKGIILQKCLPHRNNRLCDLEEEDIVETGSDITVLFVPIIAESEPTSQINYETYNVLDNGELHPDDSDTKLMAPEDDSTIEEMFSTGETIAEKLKVSITNLYIERHNPLKM